MDTKKLVSWIHKNWYHGYENIGIMDAKNWYHRYGKIGIMDTWKLVTWYEKIGILDTDKLVSVIDTLKLVSWIRKKWYHGYTKIGIMETEKLVSWIWKNWCHGYAKYHLLNYGREIKRKWFIGFDDWSNLDLVPFYLKIWWTFLLSVEPKYITIFFHRHSSTQ